MKLRIQVQLKKQGKVIQLLHEIHSLPQQIDWDEIMEFQYRCLKKGSNGIGIPDLIIAQNARNQGCQIFTLYKHFSMLAPIIKLDLF